MSPVEIVTYDGRRYALWQGRLLLDWRHKPVLYHPQGCLLCCPIRVTKASGSRPRHPDPCGNCGFNHPGDRRRPDPCRFCRHTAHLTDTDGRPVHKTCLEDHILAALRTGTGREDAA